MSTPPPASKRAKGAPLPKPVATFERTLPFLLPFLTLSDLTRLRVTLKDAHVLIGTAQRHQPRRAEVVIGRKWTLSDFRRAVLRAPMGVRAMKYDEGLRELVLDGMSAREFEKEDYGRALMGALPKTLESLTLRRLSALYLNLYQGSWGRAKNLRRLAVLDCPALSSVTIPGTVRHLTLRRNGVGVNLNTGVLFRVEWLYADWVFLEPRPPFSEGELREMRNLKGGELVALTNSALFSSQVPPQLKNFPGRAALVYVGNPMTETGWDGAGRTSHVLKTVNMAGLGPKSRGMVSDEEYSLDRMPVMWANERFRGHPIDTFVVIPRVPPSWGSGWYTLRH